MRLPPSALINDSHFYISGQVIVHPSAVIAPGVLLQADPGSQLTIAAGVSIGAGSVLHAHDGALQVETGVTLGSGVLIIGEGTIGAHACIGSMATILNSSIEPGYSVPPSALIGDTSCQGEMRSAESSAKVEEVSAQRETASVEASAQSTEVQPEVESAVTQEKTQEEMQGAAAPQPLPDPWSERQPVSPGFVSGSGTIPPPISSSFVPPTSPYAPYVPGGAQTTQNATQNGQNSQNDQNGQNGQNGQTASDPAAAPLSRRANPVYGQAYLERIMVTLFPHRQALDPPPGDATNPADPNSADPHVPPQNP